MTEYRRASTTRLVVIGILVVAALAAMTAHRVHQARREAATSAAIDSQLDRLASPAPTRAPVSLRPGGR